MNQKDRLKILVEQVERTTGLKDFGIYMSKLITLDALFLNEVTVERNHKQHYSYLRYDRRTRS